jgi:hypothetical protein
MAGSRSLVLVECNGKYYYYRGLTDKYKFGEEFDISNIPTSSESEVISTKDDTRVHINNAGSIVKMTFEEVVYFINKLSFDLTDFDANSLTGNLVRLFSQMTVCYNSEQISKISDCVIGKIVELEELKTKILRNQFLQILENNQEPTTLKQLSIEIKLVKTTINERYRRLLEFVNTQMVSIKGCVSKNHTLERIKRKNDIKKNVSTTLAMSTEDIVNEVTENTKKEGVVIFDLNGESIIESLKAISLDIKEHYNIHYRYGWGPFRDANSIISKNYILLNSVNSFEPNVRCPNMDGTTYSSVVSITKQMVRGFSHSNLSVTIPTIGNSDNDFTVASMALPLFDEFVDLLDPYSVDWANKCNDFHIAHFRIALRSTFVWATECRDFNLKDDSVEVGMTMCLFILSYVERYIETVLSNKIPTEGSALRVLRGSVSFLLTFMASGVNSQTNAWELFKSNPETKLNVPPNEEVFDIYFRLLKVIPYCCWDQNIATKNLRTIGKDFIQKRND